MHEENPKKKFIYFKNSAAIEICSTLAFLAFLLLGLSLSLKSPSSLPSEIQPRPLMGEAIQMALPLLYSSPMALQAEAEAAAAAAAAAAVFAWSSHRHAF